MRDDHTFCSYHGEVISSRTVNGLTIMEASYAPRLKLSRHSHRNAGFCLIIRGQYVESYGRMVLECRPSYVKFQPAQEEHSDQYGQEGVRSFVVELNPAWLARMGASSLVAKSPMVFRDGSVAWMMMKLRRELLSHDSGAQVAIEGLMLQLIAETARKRIALGDGNPQWLRQVMEILREQFTEPLTLSDVARTVGVHPVYLASAFRHHYRCSVGEYVRRLRIEYACDRIANTDDSLVDVALVAGFSSQSHFTRIFKRVTGMTPAQYRSSMRSS